ncbi:MAG: L,D-transpeptidase [Akkermansia sp.]
MRNICLSLLLFVGALLLASCSSDTAVKNKLPDGRLISTHQGFTQRDDYRDTGDIWYNDGLLDHSTHSNTSILINLGTQRGHLRVNGKEAMDFPVCTGKDTHETPRGKFSIIEKQRHYRSHSYGSVYNSEGNMVVSDATPGTKVPHGGEYVGASMPLWMRIRGGVGMHIGTVYRNASSHGCIRIPQEACVIVFDKCPTGTTVRITE